VGLIRALTIVGAFALLGGCASRALDPGLIDRTIASKQADPICLDACEPIESGFAAAVAQATPKIAGSRPKHFLLNLERGDDALVARVHLIRAARRSIDIQTFIWSRDDAGLYMLDELMKAAARGVRVRVLTDQLFSLDNLNTLSRLALAPPEFQFKLYNPTFGEANTSELEFLTGIVCCFWRFNQRMHNKLMVVDGEVAITGGRNIDNRYFDLDPNFVYRDRDVLVIGRVLNQVQASFDDYWRHPLAVDARRLKDVAVRLLTIPKDAARWRIPAAPLRARELALITARALDPAYVKTHFVAPMVRADRVEFWSDEPGKQSADQRNASAQISARIIDTLRGAQSRVTIQTPYLVLSRQARRLTRELKRERPDVRIVVSTNSLASTDAFYVYALSHKHKKTYVRELGFEIFETKPHPASGPELVGFFAELEQANARAVGPPRPAPRRWIRQRGSVIRVLDEGSVGRTLPTRTPERLRIGLHAKSFVLDERITLIGSHNFDPRSDDLNTEVGLIIWDAPFARLIEREIFRDTRPENAWTIAPKPKYPLVSDVNLAVSRVFYAIPFFDIWPFRYSTSYALKEGFAPVSRFDPKFPEHYESVGDFPEVDLPLKQINTLVVTAFFGWIAPIL
jgi:cardiolipin synthase C